jgi:SynChlorMet cassette radical SAM/SPASM protein ScmE
MIKQKIQGPSVVFWNVTNQCNLSCKHCIKSSIESASNELSTTEAVDLVSQMSNVGVLKVVITGGEPFTRKDIFTIIQELVVNKILILLLSNGTLITEEIASKIAAHGVRDISVSLEGSKPEINDCIRGAGSFEQALKGISNLQKYGLEVLMQVTVNKKNYRDLSAIVQLAQELGIKQVAFQILDPWGRAHDNEIELLPSKKENIFIAEKIMSMSEKYGDFIQSEYINWAKLFKNDITIQHMDGNLLDCGAGIDKCAITTKGDILPCNKLDNIKCGNIRRESFISIWNNSIALNEFRKLSKMHIKDTKYKCRQCKFNRICSGGCRASAYHAYGDLTAPDPICWYEPMEDNVNVTNRGVI